MTAPDVVDRLPIIDYRSGADLWWVGAHGGAGETTLSALTPEWPGSGHAWPRTLARRGPVRVVVTARSSARGLLAAQAASRQWAAGLLPHVQLVGLVVIADAPGRVPRPLRDLSQVVVGGFPRAWFVPWVEPWRLGEPPALETAPRSVRQLVDDLRAAVVVGTTK